jgi:hypothetical protein
MKKNDRKAGAEVAIAERDDRYMGGCIGSVTHIAGGYSPGRLSGSSGMPIQQAI